MKIGKIIKNREKNVDLRMTPMCRETEGGTSRRVLASLHAHANHGVQPAFMVLNHLEYTCMYILFFIYLLFIYVFCM